MTARGFLKGLIEHMQKLYIEMRLYPGWMTNSRTVSKICYSECIVQDIEIILATSNVQLSDLGPNGTKCPAISINKTLAYQMGWFEEDDPQFAFKLGPNLCVKQNGH